MRVVTAMRSFLDLVTSAILGWVNDGCLTMGAAIAYYAVFSLAPMLILAIAIAGVVFGREAAQGAIITQLGGLMGRDGAAAVQAMIESASNTGSGTIAAAIGIVTLLLAASGAFGEIQTSLNAIWKAKPPKETTIRGIVRRRLLSLSLVIVVGFLLLVSLIISTALAALHDYMQQTMPGIGGLLQIANAVVSFAVITVLFAMMFKVLPDTRIAWSDVWLGAAVTTALFTIAKFLISLYIGSSDVASSYGVAGALVVILLWVYYSAQVLLLGAEITRAHSERRKAR
jgi:membrane protein